MLYKELPVLPELKPYVQLVFVMESEWEGDVGLKERIMPDGIVEFVTHYADPWITTVAGHQAEVQPESFVISQMHKFIEIESNGTTGFISIRFYPWGGYHFFHLPISEFLDDTVSSVKLWPEHYHSLMESVQEAPNYELRARILQQFLLARLEDHRCNDKLLDQAVKLIRKSRGKLSIKQISEQTGLSKKQLERKFIASVGTTPKILSRISRFLNICHFLEEQQGKTLTELAHECGYFDQAHFIKEFREFSGFTPKEFFVRNNVGFVEI